MKRVTYSSCVRILHILRRVLRQRNVSLVRVPLSVEYAREIETLRDRNRGRNWRAHCISRFLPPLLRIIVAEILRQNYVYVIVKE